MATNHEKYLAGEPLTEELKELKEGRAAEAGPFWEPAAAPAADTGQPLSRAERAALRELRTGPGWPILQKLLERITLQHTEAATQLSQINPLERSDEIAQGWAYLNLFKRAHREMNALVEAEIEKGNDAGILD